MSKDGKGHGSEKKGGLDAFAEKTQKDLGLEKFHLSPTRDGGVHLSLIAVGKKAQGQGTGTEAMKRLTAYADENGHRLTLTPDVVKDHGTTSTKRLTDFYKRHGFVENKGRNKDYSTSAGMIREPEVSKSINARGDTVKPKDKK